MFGRRSKPDAYAVSFVDSAFDERSSSGNILQDELDKLELQLVGDITIEEAISIVIEMALDGMEVGVRKYATQRLNKLGVMHCNADTRMMLDFLQKKFPYLGLTSLEILDCGDPDGGGDLSSHGRVALRIAYLPE